MQLISKLKKGFRFLLCVICIFSNYAWVVSLKGKKGVSIVNAFQSILKKNLIENQVRYGQTKTVNFRTILLKNDYKTMILLCIQHIMKENLLLRKDLLEP